MEASHKRSSVSREAMKQALEALESDPISHAGLVSRKQAITALRQALETEQEPFEYWNAVEGWVKIDEVREHFDSVGCGTIYKSGGEGRSPLYTAPPKREWVRLTEKEVKAIANKRNDYGLPMTGRMWVFVADLTDKLKEKNHG